MASYWNQALMMWQDINGGTATSFWNAQDQSSAVPGPISALRSASQAISDARIVACQFQITSPSPGVPINGSYPTVADRAVFRTFCAASGVYSRVELVAPKASIFLPDNRTVDMSNPNIVAWVAALMAAVGDRNGNPITSVKPGVRQRVNTGQ